MSADLNLPTTGPLEAIGLATDGLLSSGPVLIVASIDQGVAGDDGGWLRTLTGTFPLAQGCYVTLVDGAGNETPCYGGVVGAGLLCRSTTGGTLSFTTPPLPLGLYSVRVATADGLWTATLADGQRVVPRDYTSRLFSLRSHHPHPRDVGPADIREERTP